MVVLIGDENNNLLNGTEENDSITGLGGNDTLWGYFGNDLLDGGSGDDTYLFDGMVPGQSVQTIQDGSGVDAIDLSNAYLGKYRINLQTGIVNEAGDFRVDTTEGNKDRPAITMLSDGGFVITWSTQEPSGGPDWDIFGQRYNASGNPVGSEFRVNTYAPSAQQYSDIIALSGGRFVVVWESIAQDSSDEGNRAIYGQIFDTDGAHIGMEFRISPPGNIDGEMPAIASLNDGGFVTVWSSADFVPDQFHTGIYGQRYDGNGNTVGGEFSVYVDSQHPPQAVAISSLSNGGFVVTWQEFYTEVNHSSDGDGLGIFAQRFNASGNPDGTRFLVNTITTGDQTWPAVTTLNNGNFVTTWESDGVKGQLYNGNGQPIGGEFQVGNGQQPAVAALTNGGFVVTFSTYPQGLQAQLYSNTGMAIGTAIVVNPELFQFTPDVAPLPDGGFVVAWENFHTQVYAQRYDALGNVIPGPTLISMPANSIENAMGSYDDDMITGTTLNNILTGGAGNDILDGSAGNDTYKYADGWGVDSIIDASGTDTLDLSAVGADLNVTMWATAGNEVSDGIDSINWSTNNFENVLLGSGNDTLSADNGNNSISGGSGNDSINAGGGNDTVFGGVGNDTLIGNLGNDQLNGGEDNDTYFFANGWGADTVIDASGVETINLSTITNNLNVTMWATAGNEVSDGTNSINWTTNNIENVVLGSGNDTLSADNGNNSISGGAGNDSINAGGGDDIILGGVGNDTLIGNLGNDLLDGGIDNDAYFFANGWGADTVIDASGVDTINLSTVTSNLNVTMWATAGDEVNDSINSINWSTNNFENVFLGSGNDTLSADNGNNSISGGAGNDSINAGGGNDTVLGGVGNDTLIGNLGNDQLNGGEDNDTYFFTNGWGADTVIDASGVETINLSTITNSLNVTMWATAGNEVSDGTNSINWTTNNIENVVLGSGNDTLSADNGNNSISGGMGNDSINAGGGDDIILGGVGNDTLIGNLGNDRYLFGLGDSLDTVSENDSTAGNLDRVILNNSIDKNNVALFLSNGNLQIGYVGNTTDLITIQGQNTTAGTIERLEASDGEFMTNADINAVLQSMSSYATNNGISLSNISDVKNNADLMNIVVSSWHN